MGPNARVIAIRPGASAVAATGRGSRKPRVGASVLDSSCGLQRRPKVEGFATLGLELALVCFDVDGA